MKKLMFIFFILFPAILFAQKNTVCFAFQPDDKGMGIYYERLFKPMGVYSSISYGKYRFVDGSTINNHIKSRLGIVKYFRSSTNILFFNSFLIGLSYSYYGTINTKFIEIPEAALHKISYDIGTGCKINHFNINFLYNVHKKESVINIGINF
jgi:hypothetical protein